MSFAIVAIGASTVIGAGAQIVMGGKAAKAQRQAAEASSRIQEAQNIEAGRQFDLQRSDLAPFRAAGGIALGQIGKGTADGGEFNKPFAMSDFQADPGYQFRRDEGQRGMEAGASARGGVLSGGAMKALGRFNSDLASQEFGQAFGRYQSDLGNRYNRLAGMAGVGQQAVSEGNQASQAYTGQLQQGANNISNNIQGAANARASQYMNTANAIGGAASTIGGYFGTMGMINKMGGPRAAPAVPPPGGPGGGW